MLKKIIFAPYVYTAKFIGLLFWPLTKINFIKKQYVPLVKLINDLFVNSVVSTFLAIWYPFILLSILANVGAAHWMIIGIVSLIPMIIGLQVMPGIIIELKNSSILKRIKATNVKSIDLVISLLFYFTLVSIISILFNIVFGSLMYLNHMHFELVNYGELILAFVIGMLVALSFGIFISGVLRSAQTALVIGLLLTLPGAFLSGQFLPPNLIATWGPVRYLSFVFPQKIASTLALIASNNGHIFDLSSDLVNKNILDDELFDKLKNLHNQKAITISTGLKLESLALDKFILVTKVEHIIALALAPAYLASFVALSAKTFKWGKR